MGVTLTGKTIASTYTYLLKVSGNSNIGSSIKKISDGDGNEANLYLSTTQTLVGAGSVSVPSLAIYGSTTTGLYSPNANQLGISIAGSQKALFYSGGLTLTGDISVSGGFKDSNNTFGTSGQVLASTGSGTDWVNLSEISGIDGSGTLNTIPKFTPDGNTIGDSTITDDGTNVTIAANVKLGDSKIINLGSGNDLQIFHNGTDGSIRNFEGDLILRSADTDKDIIFQADDGSGSVTTYFFLDGSSAQRDSNNNLIHLYTVFPDKSVAGFGDDIDLKIYRGSSKSYIEAIRDDLTIESIQGKLSLISPFDDTEIYSKYSGGGYAHYLVADASDYKIKLFFDGSQKLETNNDGIEVTGDVEADEFIGDLRGAVLFIAQAGEALTKGDVVYISGISGTTTVVSKADNDAAGKMPAFGLVNADASLNASCEVVTFGTLSGIDTSSYSEGDELYVSQFPAGLQNTKPAGESRQVQKIAKVTRSHATAGSVKVIGAGRVNDTPNLDNGNIFIGNSSNEVTTVSLSSEIQTAGDNRYLQLTGGTLTGGLLLQDNVILDLGTDNDLRINHTGSAGVISNRTGDLTIQNGANDSDIILKSDDGSGGLATYFALDGSDVMMKAHKKLRFLDSVHLTLGNSDDLKIYHDGTDSVIQNETGDLEFQNRQDDGDIKFKSDDGIGGVATYLTIDGGATLTKFHKNTKHTDNIKATFGDSADLEIYHNGTHSYIDDAGTGKLILRGNTDVEIHKYTGEYMITATADGAVSLYFDDSKKLETTNVGITVSGTTASSSVLINGGADAQAKILGTTTAARLDIQTDSHHRFLQTIESDGRFRLYNQTTSAEQLTVLSDGKTGINTSSPSRTLDIRGDAQILSTGATGLRIVGGTSNEVYMIFGDADDNSMGGFGYDNNTNTLTIDVNNAERINIASDGTIKFNSYGAGYLKTDANGVISVDTSTIEDTLDSVTDRGATTTNAISVGGITSSGSSSGRYTGLEVVNTTNAGGTETAIGLGVVSAANSACDVKLVANRVAANSGSDFYIEQTNSSGTQVETFRIAEDGNATFAGNVEATGSRTISAQYDSNHFIRFESNSSGGVLKGTDGGVTTILARSYGDTFFDGGNFGIGTGDNPAQKLHVVGTQIRLDNNSGAGGGYYLHDGSGTFRAALWDNGTNTRLFADGNGSTAAIEIESNNATFNGDITIVDSSPQVQFIDTTNNTDAYIYSDDTGGINISADENNEQGSSTIKFYIDGGEKARLDSSGNLGIGGTNNGNSRLSVHGGGLDFIGSGANTTRLRFYDGTTFKSGIQGVLSTGGMIAGAVAGDLAIRSQSNILFATGGNTERVRIDSSGNFLAKNRLTVGQSTVNGAYGLYAAGSFGVGGNASFAGNVSISGDLTVSGTTTTIDTTNLDVKDKNITLNYGSGDTSSNADGAGITIQDAVDADNDATILWDQSDSEFDFSHGASFNGNVEIESSALPILRLRYNANYYTDINTNGIDATGTNQTFAIRQNGNSSLSFDASQNATFAKDIVVNGGDATIKKASFPGGVLNLSRELSSSGDMTSALIQFQAYGNNTTLRTFGKIEGRSNGYNGGSIYLYTQNAGTETQALLIDENQKATFSGDILVNKSAGGLLQLRRDDSSIAINNRIGTIEFQGNDPSSANTGALIFANAAGTWDTNDYPTKLFFQTDNAGTLTTALTLDDSQNATFAGTISSKEISIKQQDDSGFDAGLTIERSANTQKVHIGMDGGAVNFNSPDGLSYKFRNNGTEKFTVDGSGNATFEGTIETTGITIDSRLVLDNGRIYDNATNGNNKGFRIGGSGLIPINGSAVDTTNIVDLGSSSTRFKDLYLSGGANITGAVTATSFSGDGANISNVYKKIYEESWSSTPEAKYIEITLPFIGGSGGSDYYYFDVLGYRDIGSMDSQLHYRVYLHNRAAGVDNNDLNADVFAINEAASESFGFGFLEGGASTSKFLIKVLEDYSRVCIVAYPSESVLTSSMISSTETEPSGYTDVTFATTRIKGDLEVGGNGTFAGNTVTIDPASGDATLLLQSSTQTLRLDQNSIRTTTNSDLSLFTNGNDRQLYLDQSTGGVGLGVNSTLALLHINGSGDAIRVESTNTGAGGAQIDLLHFTTSPADEDTHGMINMGGYYTGTTSVYGSQILSKWTDVSERHSRLEFKTLDTTLSTALTLAHDNSATFTGQLRIEAEYPTILLTDTNHNDDWGIYNNNGKFLVYNSTDSVNSFQIDQSNDATFAGDITTLNGLIKGTRSGANMPTSSNANLYLIDSRSMTNDVGGSIVFGGIYNNSGDIISGGPFIKGYKENNTAGDYGFGLKFAVRENGSGAITDPCLTLNSTGNAIFSKQLRATDTGSTNSPTYSFDGNTTVGMMSRSTNTLEFITNGSVALNFYADQSAQFLDKVGIGLNPVRDLHVKKSNSGGQVRAEVFNTSNTANSHGIVSIYSGGANAGDPFLHWKVDEVQDWSMGIDNSDSDKLKISKTFGLGTNDYLTIGTDGYIGMGIADTNNQRLTLAEADANGSHIKMNNSRTGGGYWVVGVGDSGSSSSIVDAGGLFFYNGTTKLKLDSSGNATFAANINTVNRLAITETTFGYSSSYKVVQYGETGATKAISIGYSPSGNTNGGFSGNEILIPNNIRILAPNAADDQFYGVMMFDDDDKLLLGSSNYLIDTNYILKLDPSNKSATFEGNVTINKQLFANANGDNVHILTNESNNGEVLRLQSTGDNRILYLQSDHVFSNGAFYLGSNSHSTNFRGSSYNFENGNASFAGNVTLSASDLHLSSNTGEVIWGAADDYNSSIGYVDNGGGDHYLALRTRHAGTTQDTLKIHANTKLSTFAASVTVGDRSVTSSTTNYENVLRVKGKNNYSDGTTWYGTYGQILLHSDTNMTGSARRFLITNALGNNAFAIVRSVDGNTDPVVNSTGGAYTPNSGTADFVIRNDGKIGLGVTAPDEKLSVNGNIFLQGNDDYIAFNTSASSGHPKIKMNSDASFTFVNTAGLTKLTLDNGGDATFTGKITTTGDPGLVVTGAGNSTIHVASTGSSLAGMYMDASNGDFIGSDYVFIGQDNDLTYRLEAFDSAGDILLKESGVNSLRLSGGNATFAGNVNAGTGLRMYTDGSGNGVIYNLGQDKDLYLVGDDGGSGINALVFDMSEGGNATFSGTITTGGDLTIGGTGGIFIPEYIYHTGDTNSYFGFPTNDEYKVTVGGSTKIFADASNTYLYFEGSQKLRTINTGILVTGGISASATSSISCDGATKALGVSNVGTTSDPTMEIKTSGTASGASSLDIYQVNTIYGPKAINFYYGSTSTSAVDGITVTSSAVNYGTGSDYRLKENVTDLDNALERVDNLKPKRFNFKNNPDTTVDGFLAHEAQEVVPQAVTGVKDGEIDGKPSYQGIDHGFIVPLLTAAIKELKAQNEELLARIEALENN